MGVHTATEYDPFFLTPLPTELREWRPRLDADADVAPVTLTGTGSTFSASAALDENTIMLLDLRTTAPWWIT